MQEQVATVLEDLRAFAQKQANSQG
jgi:hypothetical protein